VNRIQAACAFFVLGFSTVALGQFDTSERLVVVGAGSTGPWRTVLDFANSAAESSGDFEVADIASDAGVCPGICPFPDVYLPAYGSTTIEPFDVIINRPPVTTLYVTPIANEDPHYWPSLRARAVNTAVPSQSVELPVFRESTLLALNPGTLSFPGAVRDAKRHSNLILVNIQRPDTHQGPSIEVSISAFDEQGQPLGSTAATIPWGTTLFLPDVIEAIGGSSMSGGQILVTKTGGEGVLWGLLTTLTSDGTSAVSTGFQP
jgi:hypothetical protein